MLRSFGLALLVSLLASCASPPRVSAPAPTTPKTLQALARGVTLPTLFNRPDDASWIELQRLDMFRELRRAGFTAVRMPIALDNIQRPLNADKEVLWPVRVERSVRQAERAGIAVILVARLEGNPSDPDTRARLLAGWENLAWGLREASSKVVFEILEDPSALSDIAWAQLTREWVRTIRVSNPHRTLIVGSTRPNRPERLEETEFPSDPNLILSFSYDEPASFTRQPEAAGITWMGTEQERENIEHDLDRISAWAQKNNRSLFCASFGATARAEPRSRMQWTAFVARALEARNIAWCYADFSTDAGVFDPIWRIWRQPLLDILMNR